MVSSEVRREDEPAIEVGGVGGREQLGEGGERLFDERRGNKGRKLDLEAGFVLARPDGERLIGLGSGSSPRRERILVVRRAAGSFDVRSVDAHALYASLR